LHDTVGDVLRFEHGHAPQPGRPLVALSPLQHGGVDHTGAHAIDADSLGGQRSQRMREQNHPRLCGSVDRVGREPHERRQRCRVNDGATAAAPQQRERQLGPQNHGAQIDVDDPLPLVAGRLCEVQGPGGDAGVVAEDVQAAVTFLSGGEHPARIRLAGDINVGRRRSAAGRRDARRGLPGAGVVEVRDDD
jgi:hypothetical protein